MTTEAKKKKSFAIERKDTHTLLTLFPIFDVESFKFFPIETGKFVREKSRPWIIDCNGIDEFPFNWLRMIVGTVKEIKTTGGQVRFANVNPVLAKFFKAQGISSVFEFSPSIHSALVEFGLAKTKTVDLSFVAPFIEATIRVLKVQAASKVTPGQIFQKQPDDKIDGDVSGIIALAANNINGAVVLTFPNKTLLNIMSRFLSQNYTSIVPEVEEGAGELINIIFTQAKTVLNAKDYGIRSAIPTTVCGKDIPANSKVGGPRIAIPFESDAGKFCLEIMLAA